MNRFAALSLGATLKKHLGPLVAILMLVEGLCLAAASVPTVRVVLPGDAGVIARRAAGILDRQITARCGAKVLTAGEAAWAVELGIEAGIGMEGYKIVDGPGGSVRILGNDREGCFTVWAGS
jgi:hypothetical protein